MFVPISAGSTKLQFDHHCLLSSNQYFYFLIKYEFDNIFVSNFESLSKHSLTNNVFCIEINVFFLILFESFFFEGIDTKMSLVASNGFLWSEGISQGNERLQK